MFKPKVEIGILNIMPNLEDTENILTKALTTNMLQVNINFIYLESFTKDKIKKQYIKNKYHSFKSIKNKIYDGIIITGAPLEHFLYQDINYIKELNEFLDYTKKTCKSTIFICWASIYALNYFYNIPKIDLEYKLSGIYPHYIVNDSLLTKGFDDFFLVPQSRYTTLDEKSILKHKDLKLISKSNISGVFIVENTLKNQIFITGHLEYEKDTLEQEYLRDLKLNIKINKPYNYYLKEKINYNWLAHQYLFYHNWLYNYVFKGYL